MKIEVMIVEHGKFEGVDVTTLSDIHLWEARRGSYRCPTDNLLIRREQERRGLIPGQIRQGDKV